MNAVGRSLLYSLLVLAFLAAFNTCMNVFMARVQNVERILRLEHERANQMEKALAELEEREFQRQSEGRE